MFTIYTLNIPRHGKKGKKKGMLKIGSQRGLGHEMCMVGLAIAPFGMKIAAVALSWRGGSFANAPESFRKLCCDIGIFWNAGFPHVGRWAHGPSSLVTLNLIV